jgi:glycosyltransferase involved in cell wall biosynthesis
MKTSLKLDVPKIQSVEEGNRPFWSVMIPTYNGTKYLRETLTCVLNQIPATEYVQIEVVDDCSTADDPETLVKEIGQGRVSFYRNPTNQGLIGNWNACIQRAKGEWVHILHQDDLVLPGFYQNLQALVQANPESGAAFCRYAFIDEDGHWQYIWPLESKVSGILPNWIEHIAVRQIIQFPAIVVRRSAYEALGGFSAAASYAADWEMWKRISAHYPMAYEPQILACYRQHSGSETSRAVRAGSDIADIITAITLSESYLPPERAAQLSQQARENYALYALHTTQKMLAERDVPAALAQIQGAWRCSASSRVLKSSLRPIIQLIKVWLR